jgi:hypothetical protein
MLELNVSNVPHATASDDGLTLTIIFDLGDGSQARMHIPYGQYDWWIQAMQVVASAAFRKQVEAGRVSAIPRVFRENRQGELPEAPITKLLGWKFLKFDASQQMIKVEMQGRPEFINPAGLIHGGMLAAMLDETLSPALAATLGPGEFRADT